MLKQFAILLISTSLVNAQEGAPQFQPPYCVVKPNHTEAQNEKLRMGLAVFRATLQRFDAEQSVWRRDYLEKHPAIVKALNEFEAGKIGHSLQTISFEGKTAEQLHQELLAKEFRWITKPLSAPTQGRRRQYWKVDGKKTTDPRDKNVVLVHLYVHQDGSLIRIKAAGVPDPKGRCPRRAPHDIKSVLLNFNPASCEKGVCKYDTTESNEAFKVTEDNRHIPKAPTEAAGFKIPIVGHSSHARKLKQVAGDMLMELSHTPLKTVCPEPIQ